MPYSFSSGTTAVNNTYTIYLVAEKPVVNTTYKLTYDANGGSGAPAQQTATTTATSHQFTVSATKPTKTDAVCIGWADSRTATTAQYVAGNSITLQASNPTKTIYAVWAEDMNNNGTPDSEEDKYKVTYTDGVDTEVIFPDQTSFCLSGIPTPAFDGTPERDGYVFKAWNPEVAEKVGNADVTYEATWALDENDNGIDDSTENKYKVTYTDGVDTEVIFPDQTSFCLSGTSTPAFDGTPERDGYVFKAWNPEVAEKVGNADVTYEATWALDENDNGIDDSTEGMYKVTYTDGVDTEVIFPDQVYSRLSGTPTPAFDGTPERDGYVFKAWNPEVAEKVGNADVTYEATWALDENDNGIDDSTEGKFTVTWKNYDGQTLETDTNVLAGTTPSYDGATPVKPDDDENTYTFTGWSPAIAPVTGDVTYTATFTGEALPSTGTSATTNFKFFPLRIIRFHENGGSTVKDVKTLFSRVYDLTLPNYIPVREGYTFTGWYFDKALTKPAVIFMLKTSYNVYAGWEEILPEVEETEDTSADLAETPEA